MGEQTVSGCTLEWGTARGPLLSGVDLSRQRGFRTQRAGSRSCQTPGCMPGAQGLSPTLTLLGRATSSSYPPGTPLGPCPLRLSTGTGSRPWEAWASKETHRAATGGQSRAQTLPHAAWLGHFPTKKERNKVPWMEFQGPGRDLGYEAPGWRRPSETPTQPQPLSTRPRGNSPLSAAPPRQEQREKQDSPCLPRRQDYVIATP